MMTIHRDSIVKASTNFIVGMWTKGLILAEFESLDTAAAFCKLMNAIGEIVAGKNFCVYTREEWKKVNEWERGDQ